MIFSTKWPVFKDSNYDKRTSSYEKKDDEEVNPNCLGYSSFVVCVKILPRYKFHQVEKAWIGDLTRKYIRRFVGPLI